MNRAAFHGHAPQRDDGLQQIPWAPEPAGIVERFRRDAERHRQEQNRRDAERELQRSLYGSAA